MVMVNADGLMENCIKANTLVLIYITLDDKKHGKGIFTWSNGKRYEGQWSEGKQHGIGVMINKEGVSRESEWRNGKPC